jgi:TonB-dependent SusC/RagA subfamily outer membrane receptor
MKTLKPIVVLVFGSCLLLAPQAIIAQSKTIGAQPNYKNIYEMFRDVPGLEVVVNNGRGGSVVVRGMGSLTRQGQPVYVVNGSVYTGDIGSISPQDVESISILKDAASTTAYGSQGSFGVIVIVLKRGVAPANNAAVSSHTESAYTYFIDHKTPLKVFDMNEAVIIEGVIQKQKGDTLVFTKKRKDFLVPISNIKRVEMVPQQ